MYKKAKSCVRVGNEFTRTFVCHIGVRQGENLSPLLFAIFLNDLVGYMSQRFEGLNLISDDIDSRDETIRSSHDTIRIDTKGDDMVIFDTIRYG